MYLVFGLGGLVRIVGYVAAVCLIAVLAWDWPSQLSMAVFRQIGMSVLLTLVVVVIAGKWGWRWLWRCCDRLNQWVYPDLNGTWRGTISSNFPLIKTMADAAAARGETFDALSQDSDAFPALSSHPVTLRITADWFRICVRMEADTGYSESQTFFVYPVRHGCSGPHELHYVFENRTPQPKPTDSPVHHGAARLTVEWGEKPALRGVNWTDRVWWRGMNTAGLVDVERISSDPAAPITGSA